MSKMNKEQYRIKARKSVNRTLTIGLSACVAGWLALAGTVCSLSKYNIREPIPDREYVIENAEILEYKGELDYLVLRDKTNTDNKIKLRYGDVEQFNLPKEELTRRYQKPFALVREYDAKTNTEIYPIDGISPRKYIR